VDCAHGAAYKSTALRPARVGRRRHRLCNAPDGMNINKDCGSMHPNLLCQKSGSTAPTPASPTTATPTACSSPTRTGKLVDGDDIMAVAALDLLARDALKEKTLVSTVMSNAGLDAAVQAAGGKVVRTDVGDRNVIDEMLRHGFNLGGEQSGHLIFRDFSTTGDGWSPRSRCCAS